MSVTLRQLSYFLALAEERSFVRAAQKVHVTQPALSMQIKEMEANLNVALVERLPREVRLTRAGRAVEARARRIVAEIAELEGAARRQGLTGRINLGVIPTIAPYLLPASLPVLRQRDVTRDIRIREAQTDTLLDELERGVLDAVVMVEPGPSRDLVASRLFEDRFLLAGSADRLARLGGRSDALRPRGLDPDQLLLLDEGHCLADQALDVCGLTRRQTRLDLGASSLSTLCGLVGQGFGLTFVPELAVGTELAAVQGMRLVRFARPEPARMVALVRRTSSEDGGWFEEIAGVLGAAGEKIVTSARATCA